MVRETSINYEPAPIGVIAAMDEELAKYLEIMTELRSERAAGAVFYLGKIDGKPIVAAKCGIGKVNSAMITVAMIMKYAPRAVINTGVAGGVGVDTLSTVVGINSVQYDFDLTAFGDPLGLVDGFDSVYIEADRELCDVFRKTIPNAFFGTIASADRFVTDGETLAMLKKEFGAYACDFETAAVYQVATRCGVPAISLRVISDGNGNHTINDYETFKDRASDIAADAVRSVIKKL